MVCHEGARPLDGAIEVTKSAKSEGSGNDNHEDQDQKDKTPKAIMFRCFRCKQSCHYDHREPLNPTTVQCS